MSNNQAKGGDKEASDSYKIYITFIIHISNCCLLLSGSVQTLMEKPQLMKFSLPKENIQTFIITQFLSLIMEGLIITNAFMVILLFK